MATVATIVFLTPRGALIGLAFVVPLVAFAIRERASGRLRSALSLHHPTRVRSLPRAAGIVALAALIAAAAAQPSLRTTSNARVRANAELYLTFDVSRSMLASSAPGGSSRFDRARAIGGRLQRAFRDVPTGVATLTNRMMPLLFPTGDERGVIATIARSVRILQPLPAFLTAARASQLGALDLAADRSYFDPGIGKRVLIVLSDLDTDFFSLKGTLELLRRHQIEPFLLRVAEPGERIFDSRGRPASYRSVTTVSVGVLRAAGWHAYEENEVGRAIVDIRGFLGSGATVPSGLVQSRRDLAWVPAVGALLLVVALVLPGLQLRRRWPVAG